MLQHRVARRRTAVGIASVGAGVALLAGAFPTAAGAHDTVEPYDGNLRCADYGYDNEFKIEASGELPGDGTYASDSDGVETEGDAGSFEVEIDVHEGDPATVDFDANTAVNLVLVKAANGGNAYSYHPAESGADGLESPKDSISHITFCWGGEGPPSTTPPGTEGPGEEPPGTVPGEEEHPPGTTPEDEDGDMSAPPAQPVTGEPTFTG